MFFRILWDRSYAASVSSGASDRSHGEGSGPEPREKAAAPAAAKGDEADGGALLLLSLLQTEGRFVDFVQQDLSSFPDSEVGAVARVVHGGCRKVLAAHVRIEAIRAEAEGQRVALEPGFDPNRVKLTGNVAGSGRLNGVLRHRGWQATDVHLPTVVDRAGALVLCPAEVEL